MRDERYYVRHVRVLYTWCYFCCFKQKTAYEMRISDCSSDVCSSDLPVRHQGPPATARLHCRAKSRSSRGRSNSLWPEATAAATRHLPLRGGKSGRPWLHRPLLREGQRADRNDL